MRHKRTWHERMVLAPAVYGISTFLAGCVGYVFGYLLMGSQMTGVLSLAFVDCLLILYLLESSRRAKSKGVG